MPTIEDLLIAGSTDAPDCRCGAAMRLSTVKPGADVEVRIYACDACKHEFQLMAWRTPDTRCEASLGKGL